MEKYLEARHLEIYPSLTYMALDNFFNIWSLSLSSEKLGKKHQSHLLHWVAIKLNYNNTLKKSLET